MTTRKRTRSAKFSYDNLESRQLLAGNVTASTDGGILLLVGDAQANQVVITQNDAGNFVVTGTDTTVNGNASFTTNGVSTYITVALQAGDDELTVDGINVPRNISFYGAEGADRLVARNSSAYHMHLEGGVGDDVFDLELTTRKSAYIYLGEGNDVVSGSALNAGRNLKIFGDDGNDTIATEALNVGRRLEFQLDAGDDNVLLSGQTSVNRSSKFDLGDGNDFAAVLPEQNSATANLGDMFRATAGDGDDTLAFDASVSVDSLDVRGGDGTDSAQIDGLSTSRIRSFENRTVSNLTTLVDAVFARLTEVNIGDEPGEVIELGVTTSTTTLNIQEGDSPVSPDDSITLAGSENVTTATIEIGGFVTGEEELTFVDTGAITGSFDDATGILTLTGTGSTAEYQTALRSVRYQSTSEAPASGTRQFTYNIETADENVSATRDFELTSVNDAPEIDLDTIGRSVIPDGNQIELDSALTVTDTDNTTLSSAVVTIIDGYVSGEDVLQSGTFAGVVPTFDASTGALTLSGTDVDIATWQDVLQSVTYSNSATTATAGLRTIRFTVDDGTDEGTADFDLTIQADNTQANAFTVKESTTNGEVVGQITPDGNFGTDAIFQRTDIGAAEQLLINADDHRAGDADAPVVLIEYLDFQCPSCKAYHGDVATLKQTFGDDLMVISRHLPLEQIHPNARAAAIASEAAAAQGMFDEMADALFDNQDEWAGLSDPTSTFEGYAQSIGLNLTEFQNAVQDSALDARVTRDLNDAFALNASGTPTFFLEESLISNPASLAAFNSSIQAAIDSQDSPFQINLDTGEIIVRDSSLLNATTDPTITIPVQVSQADGTIETLDVTINVTV